MFIRHSQCYQALGALHTCGWDVPSILAGNTLFPYLVLFISYCMHTSGDFLSFREDASQVFVPSYLQKYKRYYAETRRV